MRRTAGIAILFWLGLMAQAQEPQPEAQIRFTSVAVYIDSGGAPLAAYQIEFAVERGDVRIVGIEGGEHPAFREPPYYDPRAMQQDRAVLAAFHTGSEAPTEATRVARIHVQVRGPQETEYAARLVVAATPEGEEISAEIRLEEGEE